MRVHASHLAPWLLSLTFCLFFFLRIVSGYDGPDDGPDEGSEQSEPGPYLPLDDVFDLGQPDETSNCLGRRAVLERWLADTHEFVRVLSKSLENRQFRNDAAVRAIFIAWAGIEDPPPPGELNELGELNERGKLNELALIEIIGRIRLIEGFLRGDRLVPFGDKAAEDQATKPPKYRLFCDSGFAEEKPWDDDALDKDGVPIADIYRPLEDVSHQVTWSMVFNPMFQPGGPGESVVIRNTVQNSVELAPRALWNSKSGFCNDRTLGTITAASVLLTRKPLEEPGFSGPPMLPARYTLFCSTVFDDPDPATATSQWPKLRELSDISQRENYPVPLNQPIESLLPSSWRLFEAIILATDRRMWQQLRSTGVHAEPCQRSHTVLREPYPIRSGNADTVIYDENVDIPAMLASYRNDPRDPSLPGRVYTDYIERLRLMRPANCVILLALALKVHDVDPPPGTRPVIFKGKYGEE